MKKLSGKLLRYFLLGLMALFINCGHNGTINMNQHVFNIQPEQIIWFQIAGLEDEHLTLLKFSQPQAASQIAFESFNCTGKIWNYNLYDIRPEPHLGFLAQITGKKNITGTCTDYDIPPIWDYLEKSGYRTGVLEIGANDKISLDQSLACKNNTGKFLSKATLWRMYEGAADRAHFHYSEPVRYDNGMVYFDKSCKKDNCYSSLLNNVQPLFESLKKSSPTSLFMIRDFSYSEAIKNKQMTLAKDRLLEFERVVKYFLEMAHTNPDILILVTSTAPFKLDFPAAGKSWSEFDKKGTGIVLRNSGLVSSIYATGARSENFCGLFEEAQVLERIMLSPKKQGIQLPFFN